MDSEPRCMLCGELCATVEEVETGDPEAPAELWCWCKTCQVDTFHPLKKETPCSPGGTQGIRAEPIE